MPAPRRLLQTVAAFTEAFDTSVVSLGDVTAAGITSEQLRHAVRCGLVVRVVRGRYALATAVTQRDPWAEREAAVHAHLRLLRTELAAAVTRVAALMVKILP